MEQNTYISVLVSGVKDPGPRGAYRVNKGVLMPRAKKYADSIGGSDP